MEPPSHERLLSRIVRCEVTKYEGVAYRSGTPRYATETDLLTGEGSRRHGGRWNPKGIAVVYASLTPETALAETLASNRYYGVPIEDAMPRTFVAFEAKLSRVLDLRDGAVRRRLQVSRARFVGVDWRAEVRLGREPITQRLGRAAHAAGVTALIVASAADRRGHNLLYFPDHLAEPDAVRLLNPGQLASS